MISIIATCFGVRGGSGFWRLFREYIYKKSSRVPVLVEKEKATYEESIPLNLVSTLETPHLEPDNGTPKDKTILLSRFDTLKTGGSVKIEARQLPMKTNSIFVEQYVDARTGSLVVLASRDGAVLESRDEGRSWELMPIGIEAQKCFTTIEGHHLVQEETGTLHLFDSGWHKLSEARTGPFPWHGSWSIDQCAETGTIIWCEYPYCAETVKVWRSIDGGRSWQVCFSEAGHAEDWEKGPVRHFHMVQKCTSRQGRWYLGSGDAEHQSRFWFSDDDGKTWQEVPLKEILGEDVSDIPAHLQKKVFRFTGMVQTTETLVWATDDTFGGVGAKLCTMHKDRLGRVEVASGNCGYNEVRNFIQLDDRYALAVSEAKIVKEYATISIVDFVDGRIEGVVDLPNRRGGKSNFMNGISSRRAERGGVFFARSDNIILYPSTMITAWKVEVQIPQEHIKDGA